MTTDPSKYKMVVVGGELFAIVLFVCFAVLFGSIYFQCGLFFRLAQAYDSRIIGNRPI